ncbi:hypothetical protein GCM10028857_08220 [Salinarchaeum chitinilyticum]
MADYLDAFARESEEQITELNNALLEFEDDPSDEAAMNQIFRTAHTLKGNCGAMGFEPAEDLAHAIEDLLEAIRSNRVAVSPEVMDAIFDGVDELDAMISEAVEHGEVTRSADAEIAAIREYADAEGLAAPTDAEVEELLESTATPSDDDHSVYHVRLDVAGDPAVHGRAVVDALDDAFELLGTDPSGETIDAGDYDGTIDAAFASVVQRAAVEAALEPVDAVGDQVITDVTERAEAFADDSADAHDTAAAGGTAAVDGDEADPAELSVDELLEDEDVDQFDDLDEMAEDVGDTSEFEDLGDAGSFADLGITGDDVDIGPAADAGNDDAPADDGAAADAGATDEGVDAAAPDAGDAADDEEVEDAAAEFAKLKEEVDPVGFDELQDELADLEFDEYDSDDEVGFDELLDDDELADDGAFAESAVTAAAAEDAAAAVVDDDDATGADERLETEDAGDVAAADDGGPDATAEDLFGGADDAESADAPSPEPDPSVEADAATGADSDPTTAEEVATTETAVEADAAATADADESATDDDVATELESSDPAAEEASETETDESTPTADDEADPVVEDVTADDETFDAAAMLDSEPLDESAQSFGEGGLDLSDESVDDPTDEPDEVPAGADELDLDDSFGEMEAEAIDEAATESTDDSTDAETTDDAFDLDEADIDFGDGTIAGAEDDEESGVAASVDEGLDVGEALEDDSFGDGSAAADLDPDAGTAAAETDDDVEEVDGFGDDDSVLDLDGSAVAGSEAPAGDEETIEAIDADEVGSGARIESETDAGFDDEFDDETEASERLDADAASADDQSGDHDAPADALDDPGFSDAAEAEDDGPDVDEERIERIRSLGVPRREEDAAAAAAGTQSIRVDVEALDSMLNMVEGLVTSRARLRRALIENEPREVLEDELDDLEDVTSELQDTVMDVRLVPLRTAVNKLPRIVRDVAREEDKTVDLEMIGEDVELDRSILDEIGDPLVHLVRNAVDHGIESPEEREAAGKPAEGSVELRATRERDRVTITVEDDGAGIDADAVRDAAVEEGIHTRSEVDSMDDDDVLELIFHSGFSTAAEVTDVSGRGVGMDVVAETVDRLDGTVSIDTEPGEGTAITMELPVTLAIAEVLFVDVGGEEYGIPIKTVDEIGPVVDVETQDGQEVLVSDGGEDRRELIRLDEALSTPGRSDPNAGMLVHLRDDVREAAIHCDRVREQQEVVVKPFEGVLGDVPGLSGASVLGDGDVVTILDVETL